MSDKEKLNELRERISLGIKQFLIRKRLTDDLLNKALLNIKETYVQKSM